ncbi:hypothetical protein C471_08600 [Halorubrum saccharovorum DSM 1137]|uniref:Uncharacterized protein n=1 Tax=Halorubrum saccharovorum DSM 1137 TaxID=1227484 RepID=M0DUX2_9EURY|nr:hypothetical protein [Halorubrum saccharovorum]ELZ39325.1 hypothetical protein C471_08600 [Halorubrum saccharovorum DSM 1137]
MESNQTPTDDDTDRTDRLAELLDAFDADAETVTDAWEGAAICTSWGYGQTQVNFAQIVEVSDSGKTVLARMVPATVETRSNGTEGVVPDGEPYGESFRLHVRSNDRGPSFRGSYPYIDGDPETGTRLDSFLPAAEKTGTYHRTPSNRGH